MRVLRKIKPAKMLTLLMALVLSVNMGGCYGKPETQSGQSDFLKPLPISQQHKYKAQSRSPALFCMIHTFRHQSITDCNTP